MFAYEQDVPINSAVYARILEGLGDEPAKGAVIHIALEREDGQLHYLDIWESKEDCDRFTEERLHPVVGAALAEAGVRVEQEPPRRIVNVIDLWGPAFPRSAEV